MNKPWIVAALVAASTLIVTAPTSAQPASASAPAASAPRPGMGPGMGPGAGMGGPGMGGPGGRMGHPPRWNKDNTPGWGLMTPAERDAHRAKMREMKTPEECKAYVEQHHAQMAERAKAKGQPVPAAPRRDPCRWLNPGTGTK